MNQPDDLAAWAYLVAFVGTLVGVVIDYGFEGIWSRARLAYGDFDLGVSVARWRHFATCAKTVLFAAIVAALVDVILGQKQVDQSVVLVLICLILYCAFVLLWNRLMEDGSTMASDAVQCCPHVALARKGLFDAYILVMGHPTVETKNIAVGGHRDNVSQKIKDVLSASGYQVLNSHCVTLLIGAFVSWAGLAMYLYWPLVVK